MVILLDKNDYDFKRSIIQLRQHRNSSPHPVGRISTFLDVYLHAQNVVGRVSSRRKHSSTSRCLVNWTNVAVLFARLLLGVSRKEPHIRHWTVQNLVLGLVQTLQIRVPSGTVKEKTMDVATIIRRFINIVLSIVFRKDSEVKGKSIDGIFILNR